MAVLNDNLVTEKLVKLDGNVAAVARSCGVTRQAVHAFINRHDHLKDVLHDCRESMIDTAESSLYKAVKEGQGWAVCFFLKTQGKGRGYVERAEDRPEPERGRLIIEEVIISSRDQAPARPAPMARYRAS